MITELNEREYSCAIDVVAAMLAANSDRGAVRPG